MVSNIELPAELVKALKARAAQTNRSVDSIVRTAVRIYLHNTYIEE